MSQSFVLIGNKPNSSMVAAAAVPAQAGQHRASKQNRLVSLIENQGEVIIISGLSPGERVVVEGPADLADGDAVTEAG